VNAGPAPGPILALGGRKAPCFHGSSHTAMLRYPSPYREGIHETVGDESGGRIARKALAGCGFSLADAPSPGLSTQGVATGRAFHLSG